MADLAKELLLHFSSEGYPARIVSIRRLQEMENTIEGFHQKGLYDYNVYLDYLAGINCEFPADLSDPKSLIIIAVPSPVTNLDFTWKDKTHSLSIPPTYIGYKRTMQRINQLAAAVLTSIGFHTAIANIPLKTLAVRSGLGEYGRNNICYVPGLGSYHELVGLFSDLPYPEDEWCEPKMLDRCTSCTICQRLCPTAAIDDDRFLLHAEKCVTFHNERPGHIPFPEWINPSAHNAIIGCMLCQTLCPENRQFKDTPVETERFSQTETDLLINGTPPDLLPTALRDKLSRVDLITSLEILPRNLKAAFA
jgi:epoxyqueuosine reductase